jgi:hypothetical protein
MNKQYIEQQINNIDYRLTKLKNNPENAKSPGVVKKLTRQKRNLENKLLGL